MGYRRPEVVAVVEATLAIEGTKPGVFAENNHPTVPPKSTGAYLSDEQMSNRVSQYWAPRPSPTRSTFSCRSPFELFAASFFI